MVQADNDQYRGVELLARVELFAGLDRVALARLAGYFEPLSFPSGTDVCRQGDPPDGLYVITRGRFGIYVSARQMTGESALGTLGAGDFFGEMALLSGEPRAATVRALEDSAVVRLNTTHFDNLLRREPSVAQSIAVTLVRRIRHLDQTVIDRDGADHSLVAERLAGLSDGRRRQALEAGLLLEHLTPESYALIAPELAGTTLGDLQPILEDRALAPNRTRVLRDWYLRDTGHAAAETLVARAAHILADNNRLTEALSLLAAYGPKTVFLKMLVEGLKQIPPPDPEQTEPWIRLATDEECAANVELALAKAELDEAGGDHAAASLLLQKAVAAAVARDDHVGRQRLLAESAALQVALPMAHGPEAIELETEPTPASSSRSRKRKGLPTGAIQGAIAVALVGGAVFMRAEHQWSFALLLAAALVMWSGDLLPNYAVALALVSGWMLLGLTDPLNAMSGFASLSWLFVLSLLALADGVARSGLLFRLGLLLTKHMPGSIVWQSTVLMTTGALLAPLLPQNQARAALTAPLALTVVDGEQFKDHGPAAAVLGLATWIGSGPLMFIFLNGSPLCLLAWAMMPEASRARFDWITWLIAAGPLGLMVAVASLIMLFIVFRPVGESRAPRQRLDAQIAILGKLSSREQKMIWIMGLTMLGFIAGPLIGLDVRIVATLTFILAVLLGSSDKRTLQEMDWGYLIFLGVVLSVPDVLASVGLDKVIASTVLNALDLVGGGPIVFLLAIAAITVVTRLAMDQYQGTVLFCSTLMPAAVSLGVHPWLVAITVLATSAMWFVPNQTNSYLVTYVGSEGRLFTHTQARIACFWYLIVVLGAIVLSVPYWQHLGLL